MHTLLTLLSWIITLAFWVFAITISGLFPIVAIWFGLGAIGAIKLLVSKRITDLRVFAWSFYGGIITFFCAFFK